MRDNSGAGDARPKTKDPTLDERDGPRPPADGGDFAIGDDPAPGESRSPSDRARGEVSGQDAAPPTDL